MTNMLAVTIMGLTWTTMVWAHDPSPPDPAPTNTVTDHHKYYTKTVYQNNANKSFDDNFIDMENAEIKSGKFLIATHAYIINPVENASELSVLAALIVRELVTANYLVKYFHSMQVQVM